MTSPILATPPSRTLARSLVRITAEQYHLMIDQGIISDDASTELLNGLIVAKDRGDLGDDAMGHSPGHVLVVSLIGALAARINGLLRHLNIQLPIHIGPDSEPEPDGSIIRGQARDYVDRIPGASDVFCAIEVAHRSLGRDTQDKLMMYAAAGIPQYVIVNLREQCAEIHGDPDIVASTYRTKTTASRGETLRLNIGNGEFLEVAAQEILP